MKHVLSFFPMKNLPLVGLVLFLVLFAAVLMWVYRRGSDPFYKKMGELPLEKDSHEDGASI